MASRASVKTLADNTKRQHQRGFNRMAGLYARYVVPTYRPLAQRLVSLIDLQPGRRLLDVAAGTGLVAACALQHQPALALTVAADISRAILTLNRQRMKPQLPLASVLGDAENLPFADKSFDVVTCGFGFEFFPNLSRALQEMRRVLSPGGVLATYTWSVHPRQLVRIFEKALEKYTGPVPPNPAAERRQQIIGTPSELIDLLTSHSYSDVQVEEEARIMRFRDFQHFWRWRTSVPSMRGRMAALSLQQRRSFKRHLADELAGSLSTDEWGVLFTVARRS